MLTLELVSKKRKPIKRYAFMGIILGILTLIIVGFTSHWTGNMIASILMILVAVTFIVCLYIINYSVNFKNVIGKIFFSQDFIEIEFLQKKEIFYNDSVRNIRFKLAGYQGLNNSTLFEYIVWKPSLFSYHSGLNNFVYIYTDNDVRTFEFHIPDKRAWTSIKKLAHHYHDNPR
jgi:hypothetical protein